MLTPFLLVQVSVTLKELGLDNPTGYPNVNPICPRAGVCDPKGAKMGNTKSYPMLTLFLPVQVSVTLKELGLDNPTGYHIEDLYDDHVYGIVTPDRRFKVDVNPSGSE